MDRIFSILFIVFFSSIVCAQKDSLQIGDRYSEDQIYTSISYAQFFNQPTSISKSNFSYAFSIGFIKDIILNKQGNVSLAGGIGYGFDFFNHHLKVDELNSQTAFSSNNTIRSNVFTAHNLEFPLEFRWRTSAANKYNFWRIYTGIKFLYNVSNKFKYIDQINNKFKYSNISAYNKLQYGLTLSAGYDEFNINVFYGLSPIFKDATINGETINTKIVKFGLIFYIL